MGLFDKLESKLEQGVNGAFARAFKSEVQPVEIASGIRRAMDDRAASVGKGKRPIVPNLFTIELSPTDYDRLSAWGDELDDELIASAQEHADEQRYMPGGPLTIVLTESDDLETGVFRLRPATAKAADALAHQRNHPRPVRDEAHDHGAYENHPHDDDARADSRHEAGGRHDDAYSDDHRHDDARVAPALAQGAAGGVAGAVGAAGAAGTSNRSFTARMKDYLMGGYVSADGTSTSSNRANGPASDRESADNRDADNRDGRRHDGVRGLNGYVDENGEAHRTDGRDDEGYATHSEYERDDQRSYVDDDVDDGTYADDASHDDRGDWYGEQRAGSGDRSYRDHAYPDSEYDDDAYERSSDDHRSYADAYDNHPGAASFDDAHPDGRAASAGHAASAASGADTRNPARDTRHAWDDDDSDDGDPTGYEPAPRQEPARPRQLSPRERPWLKIDGQRYPLLGAITVLGRDDDADIVIDDPGVSRRHSEIRITHDGPHLVMSVRDLGSTNGTYVNGEHIDSTHVHDGDRLTLGRTPMTIHLGDRP